MKKLISKGAVRPVQPQKDQFFFNVFLVLKNRFVAYKHFNMEGIASVKNFLRAGNFLCSIDLKDAYFMIPIP